MATSVIMPALGMAQESGRLVQWLKREGEAVTKGEPVMEIETDKVTVEIEAPASGILSGVLLREGDLAPVGQTIAWILEPGEAQPARLPVEPSSARAYSVQAKTTSPQRSIAVEVSALARKIAEDHGIDLALIKSNGRRIEKADVLAYIREMQPPASGSVGIDPGVSSTARLAPASPKARRLAAERGINLGSLIGSGPDGAVLADDVLLASPVEPAKPATEVPGTIWRIMSERMVTSWTTVPHFYLVRAVDAGKLLEWRMHLAPTVEKRSGVKPTITDLLVKMVAFALRDHPRLNSSWLDGGIRWNQDINVGIAIGIEDGLVAPVIHHADQLSIGEVAKRREDLVRKAQEHKLHPEDITGGTFTLSNLGMYNIDMFNAIVNPPQAAILAVGRIADQVVPVDGEPVVRPIMVISLSCDHRLVDGVRGARFLDDLANLIEDPWGLLT